MWTFLGEKKVVIRKPHRCFGCQVTMEVGSMAWIVSSVDGKDYSKIHLCLVCKEVEKSFDSFDGEYDEGDFAEFEVREECFHQFMAGLIKSNLCDVKLDDENRLIKVCTRRV